MDFFPSFNTSFCIQMEPYWVISKFSFLIYKVLTNFCPLIFCQSPDLHISSIKIQNPFNKTSIEITSNDVPPTTISISKLFFLQEKTELGLRSATVWRPRNIKSQNDANFLHWPPKKVTKTRLIMESFISSRLPSSKWFPFIFPSKQTKKQPGKEKKTYSWAHRATEQHYQRWSGGWYHTPRVPPQRLCSRQKWLPGSALGRQCPISEPWPPFHRSPCSASETPPQSWPWSWY